MLKLAFMLMMVTGSVMANEGSIVNLVDADERVIQDFFQGKMQDVIIECSEGTNFPFKVNIQGEFLALESEPLDLKVKKTCYIKCEEQKELLFSTDLQTWKGFLEFFTGQVLVAVESGPLAELLVVMNQRS